ncbi:hypothetical protein [Haloplanus halophilus]|uniref:hypothetical protein n=1 Tax=Haloplanus halophilus TaxID=2949993 RepID=UPI00203BDF83|nr:hypothetical protein [Haloplanus sp. GDY1]
MSSGSTTERGGEGTTETMQSTDEALERQLRAALDAAEGEETRFHLRQALQLVEALGELR